MILKDYLKALRKLAKEHGDKEVYYAMDDEGNAFNPVVYLPCYYDDFPVDDINVRKNIIVIN
jgi:hypothetical protein